MGVKPNRAVQLHSLVPALLALTVTAAGCGVGEAPSANSPPTSTGPIGAANVPFTDSVDVTGSRAAIEAGHAEVRAVLEREHGVDGWRETREAQEVACPSRVDDSGQLDDGIGKFYASELTHPAALDAEAWTAVWEEIVRAVEPHGFRPAPTSAAAPSTETAASESATAEAPSTEPTADGAHYAYLINEHRDELTVSTQPTIGTGFGGFGVCHPWGD